MKSKSRLKNMELSNKICGNESPQKYVLKANAIHIESFVRPYANSDIIDVDTGLSKNLKYSPVFKKCIAETMVKLTGYRKKDYVIAESQTGKKHKPKQSVWHHAWDEKNGLYRMQLVDFSEHKKLAHMLEDVNYGYYIITRQNIEVVDSKVV